MSADDWAQTCRGLASALARVPAGQGDFLPEQLLALLGVACMGCDQVDAMTALRERLVPVCGQLRRSLPARWRAMDWRATEGLLALADRLPLFLAAPILSSMRAAARSGSRQSAGTAGTAANPSLEPRLLELFAALAESHPGPQLSALLEAMMTVAGFSPSVHVFGSRAADPAPIWRQEAQRLRSEGGSAWTAADQPTRTNPSSRLLHADPASDVTSPVTSPGSPPAIDWDGLRQVLQAAVEADEDGHPAALNTAFVDCWAATRGLEFTHGSAEAAEMAALTDLMATTMVRRSRVNVGQLANLCEVMTRMDARDITPTTRRCVMSTLRQVDLGHRVPLDHLVHQFRARVARLVSGIRHMAEPGAMNLLLDAFRPLVTGDAHYLREAIRQQNTQRLARRNLPASLAGPLSQDLTMPLTDHLWDITACLRAGQVDALRVENYVGNLARQLELFPAPRQDGQSAGAYAERLETYAMQVQASMCDGAFLKDLGDYISINVHDNSLQAARAMVDRLLQTLPAGMWGLEVTVGSGTHGHGGPRLAATVEDLARRRGFDQRREGRVVVISRRHDGR